MKRSCSTLFFILAFVAFTFAQKENGGLYLFQKPEQADVVLKTLNSELRFTAAQFIQMRDLIVGSAKSQGELFKTPENNTPEMVKMIEFRQTTHIEENMKTIIGEDKYRIYLQKKPELEKKMKSLQK